MARMDRVSESNETALMRPLQIRSSVQPAYSSGIGRPTRSFDRCWDEVWNHGKS